MNKEIWKWIPGFVGLYQVSNRGKLKSFWKKIDGTILDIKATRGGYLHTSLLLTSVPKKYKNIDIHRVVLEAFIGPCPEGQQAAHLDGNKHNNCLTNLAWVSPAENISHNVKRGVHRGGMAYTFTQKDYVKIWKDRDSCKFTNKELATKYGTSERHIQRICNEYREG